MSVPLADPWVDGWVDVVGPLSARGWIGNDPRTCRHDDQGTEPVEAPDARGVFGTAWVCRECGTQLGRIDGYGSLGLPSTAAPLRFEDGAA